MALTIDGISDGSTPIDAAHITQFYDLLTGTMLDQPVILKNKLTVGGNQSALGHTLEIVGVSGQLGHSIRILALPGDANPTWSVDSALGKISWGPGGAGPLDTLLYRVTGGILAGPLGFMLTQATTPLAPGAGLSTVYFKSDGIPYYRSGAAGAETALPGTNVTDPLVAQVFG